MVTIQPVTGKFKDVIAEHILEESDLQSFLIQRMISVSISQVTCLLSLKHLSIQSKYWIITYWILCDTKITKTSPGVQYPIGKKKK